MPTGWPNELIVEVAAAPCRCVAARLITASQSAIDTLSEDAREGLLATLQDVVAELPGRPVAVIQ